MRLHLLDRLLAAGLIGLPLLLTPAFAGPIQRDRAFGSVGLTGGLIGWTADGPCQSLFDTSSVPGCPGAGAGQAGALASLPEGASANESAGNRARLFFPADDGGLFGSTIFSGWGYNGSQNPDPGPGNNYFLPSGTPPGMGDPPDPADSAPEPSALWLVATGLIAAGVFRRKLARGPASSR